MKTRFIGVVLGLLCTIQISGREGETTDSVVSANLSVREVFKQMPKSLMPSLSENNRLDMIDFIDSNLKAEVDNLLGGKSKMTALTDDSISVRISNSLTINVLLLNPMYPSDSLKQVICVAQTFGTDSTSLSTKIEYYTPEWKKLDEKPNFSSLDNKRIEKLNLQTIVNWMNVILKKD